MDDERRQEDERSTASGAYAHGRLWRAIETARTHDDPATRARAEQKALAWEAVLSGMATGSLTVGSRTPVAGTPAWVTLEVAHGGFATGRLAAEQPLEDAERAMLERVPPDVAGGTDRLRLNAWFLTDEGLDRLERALDEGSYRVDVPEHGAFLVVAWLVARGHGALALDLVAQLHPFMDRLRFTPVLTDVAPASAAVVHVRTAGDVVDQLRRVRVPHQVAAMNESLLVWRPQYDRLLELWLETVEDGWPCARWPDDWPARREAWLTDHRDAAATHTACTEHRRPRSNFAILRDALERCPVDSRLLTGRDVGRIRMVIDRSVERWGAPGSAELLDLRARQAGWATRPTNRELASVVVDRLARFDRDSGLVDPSVVLEPVELVDDLHEVPRSIAAKVERAREAPIDELVAVGVIPSSEVLAAVLPQVTSHVASAPFADRTLRHLYAGVYAAFRRRRSLLLLDLAHQVRIDELPWVQAVEPFRLATPDTRRQAQDALRDAALLTLTSFPQTILPNPMVRELAALARQAELDLPFVEEVAADIFMGTFTVKWRDAAALASAAMRDTLYARYFDLPVAWPDESGSPRRKLPVLRWGKPVAEDFVARCEERAREAASGDGNRVARNGTVIEQSQILTTHNLAPLVTELDLGDELRRRAPALAASTFEWIVREQNIDRRSWHSKLQMVKNTADAWRQAIFFLSFLPEAEQFAAVHALRSYAAAGATSTGWRHRFGIAIDGLDQVVRGGRFDPTGRIEGGRRFLGWSVGPHWLLPSAPQRSR